MNRENSFLGTGWAFPPQFDRDMAGVNMVSGEEDIAQSLQILLHTLKGERIMRQNFGCALNDFVFADIGANMIAEIKGIISSSLLFHETRIKLDKIDISTDKITEGLLYISIDYIIRSSNTRHNMVFPFYVNEGVK